MTDRIIKMKKNIEISKFPLCVERLKISMEALSEVVGQATIIQRAHVNAAVLDKIPIHINEGELIVGCGASKPMGIEMEYEYGVWTPEEIESLKSERYTIEPEDEKQLYELLESFGTGKAPAKTLMQAEGEVLGHDERMWKFMKSGIILAPWKERDGGSGGGYAQSGLGLGPGFDLFCVDYEVPLKKGARGIIDEAKNCLSQLRYHDKDCVNKRRYWLSIIEVYEAWIRLGHRYSALAKEMAEKETDEVRRAELIEISERCLRVPEFAPTNFKDALQMYWFTFLLVLPAPTGSMGRPDQFLYPFYKKDLDAGIITDDEVLELLETIRIMDFQMNRVSGKANREKNSGMAKWHNATLGGVLENGEDGANELSLLFIKAAAEVRIPHHTITLRINEKTPENIIIEALKCVRTGVGMPAFVSDKSYIKFLTEKGLSFEDSSHYVMCGCLDPAVPGRTRGQTGNGFNLAMAYEVFLNNGYDKFSKEDVGLKTGDVREFTSFEEHKEKFYKQLAYFIEMGAERNSVAVLALRDLCPNPFKSAIMGSDGVTCGQEMMDRCYKPFDDVSRLVSTGGINVADSLTAVKTLVYDQKKYTMSQLMDALEANWVGYDEMYNDFRYAPKYGNNIPEADEMVADLYHFYVQEVEKHIHPNECHTVANAISIAGHQPAGMMTGALPDGKHAKEILADGSISPVQGRDTNGPLAVFESGMRVNQDEYAATLLNMKFSPAALKTDDDLRKLALAVKTYLTNGGKHVQFTVANQAEMIDAQRSPENHKDLIVRVAGYSAYFTVLSKPLQGEIIARTSQQNI